MRLKGFSFTYIFVLVVIILFVIGYQVFFNKPKAGFIPGQSSTIIQLPKPGNATSVLMDFSKCSKGSDTVYFGFGSIHFAFEGINNNNCVFYYGTEIENPN